ncbi:MAG: 3-phosphoshikimate 1-carboxyvinyltransferase [Clostridia bacterium]|nr:3-phosphoshikimate 1-carboxyvinyltransferase [Clostridia bacterium]
MIYSVKPKLLSGDVVAPPSKSYAHRAVICAALSQGKSKISRIALSKDILATIDAVRALGAKVDIDGDTLIVEGMPAHVDSDVEIDCCESGSTLRFIIPIALTRCNGKIRLIGRGRLGARPLLPYFEIFDSQGIFYCDKSTQEKLDLTLKGNLLSDEFELRGDISSQFISGLLLALPGLSYDSKIKLTTPLQSGDYIKMTLDVMSHYGVIAAYDALDREFSIFGAQEYNSGAYAVNGYEVEGDYSQAAFYYVANAIGGKIKINGLNPLSAQGDMKINDMLLFLSGAQAGRELKFDVSNVPDIVPVFSVACALRKGVTRLSNAGRLRLKECDRLAATVEMITALGGDIYEHGDSIVIRGVDNFKGGVRVKGYNDHRMVMSAAIAAGRCNAPIEITDCESIAKSYPDFFERYGELGGEYSEIK